MGDRFGVFKTRGKALPNKIIKTDKRETNAAGTTTTKIYRYVYNYIHTSSVQLHGTQNIPLVMDMIEEFPTGHFLYSNSRNNITAWFINVYTVDLQTIILCLLSLKYPHYS